MRKLLSLILCLSLLCVPLPAQERDSIRDALEEIADSLEKNAAAVGEQLDAIRAQQEADRAAVQALEQRVKALETTPKPPPDPEPLPPDALYDLSKLRYLGAFKLPGGPGNGNDGRDLSFGAHAMAVGNGGLYVVGHTYHDLVCQVTLPEPKIGTLAELPRAEFMQPFADATGGIMAAHFGDPRNHDIGGLLVYNGKLIGTIYHTYATIRKPVSHFVCDLDLKNAVGPYALDVPAPGSGLVSGYLASVPEPWRTKLGAPVLCGNNGTAHITATSHGPAAFGFDPLDLGRVNPVPTKTWLYYTTKSPQTGDASRELPWWSLNVYRLPGCVFLPDGVLFFGRRPAGQQWYGGATITIDGVTYTDPCSQNQGGHSERRDNYVSAYDPADFLAVMQGTKKPWELRPYAEASLTEINKAGICTLINAAAYDETTGRVYITRVTNAEGPRPIIDVYEVN